MSIETTTTTAARAAYHASFSATHDVGLAESSACDAVAAALPPGATGFFDAETLTWTPDEPEEA